MVIRQYDVIIIGAGLAGLTAATYLQNAGKSVCVLEKSRGVGGRMSTRVVDNHQWDQGAQYFTVQSQEFRRQVDAWIAAGVVASWDTTIGAWDGQNLTPTQAITRYVGVPLMKSPLRLLAEHLEIFTSTEVKSLQFTPAGWQIFTQHKTLFAQQIILALPATQTRALIDPQHAAFDLAKSVVMSPCWALMLAAQTAINLPFAGIFINSGDLAWVAQDGSKPGRNNSAAAFVVHATPEWSAMHLEKTPEEITPVLTAQFNQLLTKWCPGQELPTWHVASSHRWRFARGEIMASYCVWPAQGLGLAGDWLQGGRVEGAYLSGLRCAQELLAAEH